MKFIKWAFGSSIHLIWNDDEYKILFIIWPLKCDSFGFYVCLFQWKIALLSQTSHDFTCSRRKCYVTCGHNIIYDMTLSTE